MRFPWTAKRYESKHAPRTDPLPDHDVARLTARADLIVEELDAVVSQMSTMLRKAYPDDAP